MGRDIYLLAKTYRAVSKLKARIKHRESSNMRSNHNNQKLIQEEEEKVTKQFLDIQILYLLRSGPKTLYSMRGVLLEMFGVQRSFGTIHPHLTRLEKLGLIEGFTIDSGQLHFPKRIYRLTRKGRSSLEREINLLSKMVTKMSRNAR
jgi:DNA-binding PadR family transcriptional regulator